MYCAVLCCGTLYVQAVERCEEELLAWAREIRERWFRVPQLRALRQRLALQSALDLSAVRDLFPRGSISISQLQKYCSREVLAPRTVLIAEGSCERRLFLQVSGRVKVFCSMGTNNPMAEHVATVAGGSFVNEEGFFLAAPSDVTVVVVRSALAIIVLMTANALAGPWSALLSCALPSPVLHLFAHAYIHAPLTPSLLDARWDSHTGRSRAGWGSMLVTRCPIIHSHDA
jgi:hypothetical protein